MPPSRSPRKAPRDAVPLEEGAGRRRSRRTAGRTRTPRGRCRRRPRRPPRTADARRERLGGHAPILTPPTDGRRGDIADASRAAPAAECAGMLLTPTERDRLLIFTAAELARARRARGLRLNVPETIALVADTVCEAARDGKRHDEALAAGRAVLGPDDVLPGVADVVSEVAVEAVFDDGSPAGRRPGPRRRRAPRRRSAPGAVLPGEAPGGRRPADDVVEVAVVNTAPVPVSVSSHFHFFEVNPRLRFDRAAGYGRHLDVPAGATVRFDPGERVAVRLVPFGGNRVVVGFSGLVDGPLDAPGRPGGRARAREGLRLLRRRDGSGRVTARPHRTDGVVRPGRPGPARRHRARRPGRARSRTATARRRVRPAWPASARPRVTASASRRSRRASRATSSSATSCCSTRCSACAR